MQEFRPMGVGGILDRAFRLYKLNFVRYVTIVAIVQVPIALILFAATMVLGAGVAVEARIAGIVMIFVAAFLSIVGRALCNGALIKSVSESYLGNEVSVGQAYRFVLPKLWTLIWASIVVGFICALGYLLCVVPGVIFSLWLALTTQAIIIENLKASEGMKRSKALAKGNLGKIFLVGLVILLIALIVGWLAGLLGVLVGRGLGMAQTVFGAPRPAAMVIRQIFSVIGQVLAAPIGAAAFILLYYDLRIRKEGFDLEMLAKRLGSGGMPSDGAAAVE